MNIWFTGDTHFGHTNVIKHSKRPFSSVEDHDAALIHNWNSLVQRCDAVYHVGDFAWHHPSLYRKRLNGQIHLIKGNHDRIKAEHQDLFASISDIKKVKIDQQIIYLCHYAMRVWNRSHYGSWHLYGHSHGSLADDPNSNSFDIGVDCHNYYPVHFDGVKDIMSRKQWRAIDHHAPREKEETNPLERESTCTH